jgi:hypothetical protein
MRTISFLRLGVDPPALLEGRGSDPPRAYGRRSARPPRRAFDPARAGTVVCFCARGDARMSPARAALCALERGARAICQAFAPRPDAMRCAIGLAGEPRDAEMRVCVEWSWPRWTDQHHTSAVGRHHLWCTPQPTKALDIHAPRAPDWRARSRTPPRGLPECVPRSVLGRTPTATSGARERRAPQSGAARRRCPAPPVLRRERGILKDAAPAPIRCPP